MIYMRTNLQVADNTGAKLIQCIKVIGGSGKDCATIGDTIVVSIKEAAPNAKVKKGDVHRAIVVRISKEFSRPDGSYVRFGENAAVLINKQSEPLGTRVFGPVSRELRGRGYMKIVSLAPEVV